MHRSKKRKLGITETHHNNNLHPPRKKRRKLKEGEIEMKTSSVATMGSRRNKKKNFKKKMKIKAFAVSPKLSRSYEKETCDKLMGAVSDIHLHRVCRHSFEELYRSCSSLCSLKKGKLIYDKLYILCDRHIAQQIARLLQLSDYSLLMKLSILWDAHRSEMTAIRQVFLMLDRTYVRTETEMKSLWKMGIHLLYKHINAKQGTIVQYMMYNVLLLIEKERNGEEIDVSLIKRMVEMMAHLNMYKTQFEAQLIESSTEYYLNHGAKLIESLIIRDYLQIVMKCLEDEHLRCVKYLENKTQRYLCVVIEEEMINKHVSTILDRGFNDMMDEELISDLRHLYKLFQNVSKLAPLQAKFEEYCKLRGCEIVNVDRDMISKLLRFKKKLDGIIQHAFQGNPQFRNIIRKSWEYFMNCRQNKPAELMAKFIDYQLQTGARGTSESELEEALDGVMDIFRFVHGKDVFCAFYKKDLAKRLLLNTSSSFDAEKNMINRIRKECGQTTASNLENMFKDIDISCDLNEKYKEYMHSSLSASVSVEFNFNVLTSGCWPTYNTQQMNLPPIINDELARYHKFYIGINSGRKLKWSSSLSHCIIAANFPRGRKELVLSAFQATVLMLFNASNKFKFSDIISATNICEKELKKTMLSLVKANILFKKTRTTQIAQQEEFKLNGKYENRLRRVKVNQIQIIETKEEVQKTSHKIKKDRQYQIDACIVRVMKARKELFHQQLMAQCLKQLKFDAIPKQIKKRIEALIENEYLERDKKNSSLYHYKA